MKNFLPTAFYRSLFTFLFLVSTTLALSIQAQAQNDNRVPFSHRVGDPAPEKNIFNIRGDFTIIGNTNLTLADYDDLANNSNNPMIYVDVDQDENTVNSSSADLVFSRENGADPNCSEILYAGLYWSGRARPGLGFAFSVTSGTVPGEPQTINNIVQTARHGEAIDFSTYSMRISRAGSDGNRFPRFTFSSSASSDTYQFEFTNHPSTPGRYRIGTSGPWTLLSNQVVETQGELRFVSFDPIQMQDADMIFTVDRLERIADVDALLPVYQTDDNFVRITANGTFIPQIPNQVRLDKRRVDIKGPGAAEYTRLTATTNNILFPFGELEDMYVGYHDITEYVKTHGLGEYTVANMALTEGDGGSLGFYGHWGMVVVYENSRMNWRDVTVFDGYSFVRSPGNQEEAVGELLIDGFNAVNNGPVNFKLGVMAGEGDRGIQGDFLDIRNADDTEWVRLRHPLNTPNNFFNSSIYTPVLDENGNLVDNPRNPFLLNNTGIDIAMWNVPNPDNSVMANGQTSTIFRYGTRQDIYNIYAIAFAVDAYVPDVQGFNQILNINGEAPDENPTVAPGQEIQYQLELRNLGVEAIENGKIIIPIPYTTTFVSADFEAFFTPNGIQAPVFDPELGPTGSIVWEFGDLIVPENIDDLLAVLNYTLKVTEDCFLLSQTSCEAFVSINGSISGRGQISESEFSGIPLVQGFLDGECEGEPIHEAIVVPITGAVEFVAERCSESDRNRDFLFCNVDEDFIIDFEEISAAFPKGTRFFDGTNIENAWEFDAENPFPSELGTYYAAPANSGKCFYPFLIQVTNVTTSPDISDLQFCVGENITLLSDWFRPSNAGEDDAYTLYFFESAAGGEAMSDFEIDRTVSGEFQVWVAEGVSATCTGPRTLVTIRVSDCSLELVKTANRQLYSKVGDVIEYSLTLTNTGTSTLTNILLEDPLTGLEEFIPSLEAGGSITINTSYVIEEEDIERGFVLNNARVSIAGEIVDEDSVLVTYEEPKEIIANDDLLGDFPVEYVGFIGNILSNDLLAGLPVVVGEVSFEFIDLDGIEGLSFDENGDLFLNASFNEAREYTLRYVLREVANPSNSDEGLVIFRLFATTVDLSIEKTSHEIEIFEGEQFEYLITVRNSGPTFASNVEIVDELPSMLSYVESRFEFVGDELDIFEEVLGNRIIYRIPFMPSGAVVRIYLKVRANDLLDERPQGITNRVSVWSDEEDSNPEDNVAEDNNSINPFFIPNVITPNGDGKNDRFEIKGIEKFERREITILNRYGDHVFESPNYNNTWDAHGLPSGTYFFVLRGTDRAGQVQEFKGWIQVIKN